jgi:predicted N-acyltransferase
MVRKGNTVVFDSEGSFCVHKKTGRKFSFEDVAGGWDLILELESPDRANEVRAELLAELKEEAKQDRAASSCHVEVLKDDGQRALEATAGDPREMGPFGRRAHWP